MGAMERLRRLDRRAEAWGQRYQRKYDVEPPLWIKYGGLAFILLGSLSLPLSIATSPTLSVAVMVGLLLAYVVVVVTWVARHRV